MKQHLTTHHLCMLAFAVVINIVGSEVALLLHLPVYLDSVGTFMIAALYGPIFGMLPGLLSGLLFGILSDIYSLYYAPVGMLLGFLIGIAWRKKSNRRSWIWITALIITIPTSLFSACITAGLFGGITSSGSTVFVQLLAKTPLGLTLSCFIVQFFSEYCDRLLSMYLVSLFIRKMPRSLLQKIGFTAQSNTID